MKITTQVLKPADDEAFEYENAVPRNLNPNITAMNQKMRCRVPIQFTDSVDCEKIHATGANPTSRMVVSINIPTTIPMTSASRAW